MSYSEQQLVDESAAVAIYPQFPREAPLASLVRLSLVREYRDGGELNYA